MQKRFRIENDRVSDLQSGLMWCRDAALSEFPLSWAEAIEFVESLNSERFASHADWRLPNRRELFSLISHDRINPALPAYHPFENVFPGYYWTATTCCRLPAQAWYIHLGGAKVYRGMKYASYMVWPVRTEERLSVFQTGQIQCYDETGQTIPCVQTLQAGAVASGISWPDPRFADNGETVADRLTGLVWTRRADIGNSFLTWEQAKESIRRMNGKKAFGFSDWRLPHIRELESLVDMGTHTPALPVGHPFDDVREFYWSATTSRYETRYAWTLYLQDGAIGVGFKENPEFCLWPVRGTPGRNLL